MKCKKKKNRIVLFISSSVWKYYMIQGFFLRFPLEVQNPKNNVSKINLHVHKNYVSPKTPNISAF